MNAVILAGGAERAEQLRPLAYPAHLLPVANRPLIEHQLAWLARQRVKTAIVTVDHRGASLASTPPAGLDVRVHYSPGPMGLAAALALAMTFAPEEERVLLLDGAVLTLVDLEPLYAAHERSGAGVTTAGPAAGGRRHHLRRPRLAAPARGLSLVERDAHLRPGQALHVGLEGYWREIGAPDAYLAAHLDILAGVLGPLPGREISPGVFSEGTVHLLSSTRVSGPILIGAGSVVGERASVSTSVIGAGCIIAAGARVENSVLLDGARIGRDAVITDSIVGPSARVEDGASLTGMSIVGPGARIASGIRLAHAAVA